MKIDSAGFMPNKSASNIDVNQAIEQASEGYIKQIQNESVTIDNNLQKITALHELKAKCTDLLINTIHQVNDALLQKHAFIEPEGYFLAEVTGEITDVSFTIQDIKLAQPQYTIIKAFPSSNEPVVTPDGFKSGIVNIALKSFTTIKNGFMEIADNHTVKSANLNSDALQGKVEMSQFTSPNPNIISVIINDQEWIADLPADEIVDNIVFTNHNNQSLTLEISRPLPSQEAADTFNNAFGIDRGIDIMILNQDSLQTISSRLNRLGKDLGITSYILRAGDNQYHLTIKSAIGKEIVISGEALPEYTVNPAAPANLILNDQLITSVENKFELLADILSIHLINNSPTNQMMHLSIEADLALMVQSLEAFCDKYNAILDFYSHHTARDILGKWLDTAILHDSNALDLTKSQLQNTTLRRMNEHSLTDFGIMFDDKSHLRIDTSKLIHALIEEEDRQQLGHLINNFTEKLKAILHYNGPISKELDHIWQHNDIQSKKINNIEKKLRMTQADLYRQFSNLEAQMSQVNHTLKLLESTFNK